MIHTIHTSENTVAFRALAQVTKEDFDTVLLPEVASQMERMGEINFLIVLDTDSINATVGSWIQNSVLELIELGKWQRVAIVTDSEDVVAFASRYSYIALEEFRILKKESFNKAIHWVEEGNTQPILYP